MANTVLIIGVFFAFEHGKEVIPLGVVLIVTYTDWINKNPILCLIAPGIGFGFLMVVGTQFALEGGNMPKSWLIAIIPFFLVNNLLLLNQYPDIHADANVGRKHFPIAYGVKTSNIIYGLFIALTIITIVLFIVSGYLPVLSLVALPPIPLAFFP
ncbi:prenyltransferase [Isorropodon fossajaponicum symbiont]|uniref:prenyltransferase n=1 Tax=Isorropodon fossajaponicum symbiont TaxID=883811 RepID=UPI001CEDA074|nr:prenyltransferase [Isorropodon fossajaponicum symbiont]